MNPLALWPAIVEAAKQYGVSLLLTLAAIVWFSKRCDSLEARYDQCNQRVIEYYKQDHAEMVKVIDENTRSLNRLANSK